MAWGNAFSLQLCYKYWSETVVLLLILFHIAYRKPILLCKSTFVEVCNGKTDIDNSFQSALVLPPTLQTEEPLSLKQWHFKICFTD